MARGFGTYRTYNWIKKNPVIDKIRTKLQDEGLYAKGKRKMLHDLTGVSVSTYEGWFEGDTQSPRHETIMATMTALGYEEEFVKKENINIEKELEAAAKWRERKEREREKQKAKSNGKGTSK
jgi:transcriptional regulator with XRE-family HTH domain